MRFFFRKNEKLTSEKDIDLLFKDGMSSFIHPIKVLFITSTNQPPECKVLITAPKRYLKTAVERNLVKRRIREAYRLNSTCFKNKLLEKNIGASIAFIYSSSKIVSFKKIEMIMIKQLSNTLNILEKN
jgi:ribonuclease P protein component